MPYTELLNKNYKEAREFINKPEVIDSVTKRIIFEAKKNEDIDTFNKESSVILHYDILTGELLLIYERLDFDEELFEELNESVEAFNNGSDIYDSWLQLSDDDNYYDIVTGRKNVIEELKRQDEEES